MQLERTGACSVELGCILLWVAPYFCVYIPTCKDPQGRLAWIAHRRQTQNPPKIHRNGEAMTLRIEYNRSEWKMIFSSPVYQVLKNLGRGRQLYDNMLRGNIALERSASSSVSI